VWCTQALQEQLNAATVEARAAAEARASLEAQLQSTQAELAAAQVWGRGCGSEEVGGWECGRLGARMASTRTSAQVRESGSI